MEEIRYNEEKTTRFIQDFDQRLSVLSDPFEKARLTARSLGAQPLKDKRGVRFGFWQPSWQEIPLKNIFLELWIPLEDLNFALPLQRGKFRRLSLPLQRRGALLWSIVEGLPLGTETQSGAFYCLRAEEGGGASREAHDPLASSVPFGAFAPAEVYDMESLLAERKDKDHFTKHLNTRPDPDGSPRIQPPANILQIHPGTATAEKTLAGLTRLFQETAEKLTQGEALTPREENLLSYEAIQLMPIEPVIEYEEEMPFWNEFSGPGDAEEKEIRLKKPDITNWGYDVVISGSAAVNPALLSSGRPGEFLELIETLHTFPTGPIRLILDIVYGHTDNQALGLLDPAFLAGPNMYGQNLDYTNPMVRAILLEMQKRKSSFGVDGLRVDGAQDFKYWDETQRRMVHDDEYLGLMNNLILEAAGRAYRPYMIFEDGRPWPQDDWELSSSYREVNRQHPNVHQWSPLTFAHNTPFLYTFWVTRWWRLRETAGGGSCWITGCANHDTLRRGAQVPTDSRINTRLGQTLPDIIARAYNNPAANLFTYAFLPGVPMEFLQALEEAPWSFIRNTDDRYGVKVVSEEALFLDWRVRNADYRKKENFPRLKAMGFRELTGLKRFTKALDHAVRLTGYDLDAIVKILRSVHPGFDGPEKSVRNLKLFARNWMDDIHDYCNCEAWSGHVSPVITAFNRKLRRFRMDNTWLASDMGKGDFLDYIHPCEGSVVYYGLRRSPDGKKEILLTVNLEGAELSLIPTHLPEPGVHGKGWKTALATPGITVTDPDQPVTLGNSQGVILIREA